MVVGVIKSLSMNLVTHWESVMNIVGMSIGSMLDHRMLNLINEFVALVCLLLELINKTNRFTSLVPL